MFLAFLSLAVIGSVLLLTVIAFYNKKDSAEMQTERGSARRNVPAQSRTSKSLAGKRGDAVSRESPSGDSAPSADAKEKGRGFLPVIFEHGKIPGVREHELVHFVGSGALFFIETELNPEQIDIDPDDLTPVLAGGLVLTSKQIIVFNEETAKKILISSIAKHQFTDSFLIIKRKRVKKKTDIIKISRRLVEFSYILQTLS